MKTKSSFSTSASSSSSSGKQQHNTRYKNRLKCRVLSATDLIWRLCEFIYALFLTFLPTLLNVQLPAATGSESSVYFKTGTNSNSNSINTSNGGGGLLSPDETETTMENYATRGGSKFLLLLGGGIPEKTDFHYEIMDTRVYNFLLNPVLTFCYFIGFFLQISISFFLFCETSNYGKSPSTENEIAACKIWWRIAIISLLILLLRFFLPYALVTPINIVYTVSRILFKVVGIVIVIIHAKELTSSSTDDGDDDVENSRGDQDGNPELDKEREFTYKRDRTSYANQSFQSTSSSVFAEIELPLIKSNSLTLGFGGVNGFNKKSLNSLYDRAKVHVAQVLIYVDKEMYDQGLAELKIAQECLKHDAHLINMESALVKMSRIGVTPDYYAMLGVSKNCTLDAIKSAYRRKSLRHHPDKHASESESIQKTEGQTYLRIREAYELLSDPTKRGYYDEKVRSNKEKHVEFSTKFKSSANAFNRSSVLS